MNGTRLSAPGKMLLPSSLAWIENGDTFESFRILEFEKIAFEQIA